MEAVWAADGMGRRRLFELLLGLGLGLGVVWIMDGMDGRRLFRLRTEQGRGYK